MERGGRVDAEGRVPDDAERVAVQRDRGEVLHVAEVEPEAAAGGGPAGGRLEGNLIGGRAGEVADAWVGTLVPGRELVELRHSGSAATGLEADVPCGVERGESGLGQGGKLAHGQLGGLAEDHEDGSPRLEVEGYGGATVLNAVRSRLALARFGVPEFRRKAGDAEGGVEGDFVVAAIVDEIEVAVVENAVDEANRAGGDGGGRGRLRVEVRREGEGLQRGGGARARVDAALTEGVEA